MEFFPQLELEAGADGIGEFLSAELAEIVVVVWVFVVEMRNDQCDVGIFRLFLKQLRFLFEEALQDAALLRPARDIDRSERHVGVTRYNLLFFILNLQTLVRVPLRKIGRQYQIQTNTFIHTITI